MFHNLHLIESPELVLLVASIIFFFSIVAGKAGFRFCQLNSGCSKYVFCRGQFFPWKTGIEA